MESKELLEAFDKYSLMPLAKMSEKEKSEIYQKGYVVVTGRAIVHPNPHRHYTLCEFKEKWESDTEFKEFFSSNPPTE